ncbi:MAG: hypothetical protein B7Y53_03975 [Halothiobacillus sp. 28-55-5]|nr:MAG: hypothetical protein B7Y53_03975 [Halothiobacillus sp. 28-55-5]
MQLIVIHARHGVGAGQYLRCQGTISALGVITVNGQNTNRTAREDSAGVGHIAADRAVAA